MKTWMFFLLLLLGFYTTPTPATSRQYHFVTDQKTWTEAQSYCRATYTDLATVDNIEDMNQLLLSASSNPYGWIGLYDDINSWRWSLAGSQYYGEGEAGFRNWESSEPDNSGSGQLCALMTSNGGWNDKRCDIERFFVCYDAGANSSSGLVLIREKLTWTEAQTFCRQNHTDLVSVRNQSENQQVRAVAGGDEVWIGLFRDGWRWSDNSSSSFRHWASGEPNNYYKTNEHCVEVWQGQGGRWNDETCTAQRRFFCHTASYPDSTTVYTTTGHQTNDHQTTGYQTTDHQTTDQQTTGHQTTGHQTTDQQTTDQQTTDHQTTDHQTTDQQTTGHQTTGHQTTDHQTTDQQTTGHQTTDHQTTGSEPDNLSTADVVIVLRVKFTSETELTESDIRGLVQQLKEELMQRGLPSTTSLSAN